MAGEVWTTKNEPCDVNSNYKVEIGDAVTVRGIYVNGVQQTTLQHLNLLADVNRNGKIDLANDAQAIANKILGIGTN